MTACHLVRSTIDHTRHGSPSHFLSRKGLSVLIDLDRLDEADTQSAFFSIDRFNLLSVKQSDYGPNFKRKGSAVRLADYARKMAAEICPDRDIASVLLLTFPRILGAAFNPVSIYVFVTVMGVISCISMRCGIPLVICIHMLAALMAVLSPGILFFTPPRFSTSLRSFLSLGITGCGYVFLTRRICLCAC